MLGLACLALGEHRRVLQHPDFIAVRGIPLVGKALHSLPGWQVVDQTQFAYAEKILGHHSTMCTRPVARRSMWIACNCSSPIAVISTWTVMNRPLLLSRSVRVVSSKSGQWRCITSMT